MTNKITSELYNEDGHDAEYLLERIAELEAEIEAASEAYREQVNCVNAVGAQAIRDMLEELTDNVPTTTGMSYDATVSVLRIRHYIKHKLEGGE